MKYLDINLRAHVNHFQSEYYKKFDEIWGNNSQILYTVNTHSYQLLNTRLAMLIERRAKHKKISVFHRESTYLMQLLSETSKSFSEIWSQ